MTHQMPTPPQPGDRVRCRTADGQWVPMIARTGPRYDHSNRLPRSKTRLTVGVQTEIGAQDWVNWPAEDVRIDYTPAEHRTTPHDQQPPELEQK